MIRTFVLSLLTANNNVTARLLKVHRGSNEYLKFSLSWTHLRVVPFFSTVHLSGGQKPKAMMDIRLNPLGILVTRATTRNQIAYGVEKFSYALSASDQTLYYYID